MKRMYVGLAGLVFSAAALVFSAAALGQAPTSSQPAGNPLISEVQQAYARIKVNVIKAAEKMPPENYSFKPTPDIRTFARVVNHVTEAQSRICGAMNKSAEAKVPDETADKAVLLDALKASFAECDKAYASLAESNMEEVVDAGPFKRSRQGMLWGNVSHDNEQYATLSLYLRLKGLVPPSSEK